MLGIGLLLAPHIDLSPGLLTFAVAWWCRSSASLWVSSLSRSSTSTASLTLRRSLRRRRALARHRWHLRETGQVILDYWQLRKPYHTLKAHHSQDLPSLRRILAAMNQQNNAPWRCLLCRQLRKHNATECSTCKAPWQTAMDKSYAHGARFQVPAPYAWQGQGQDPQNWNQAWGGNGRLSSGQMAPHPQL